MWYAEENYPDLDPNSRSLLVAFSNLLQKFDLALTPSELKIVLTQDDPIIDWWSIGEYIDGVDMGEIVDEEATWPPTSDAIVKFRRLDVAAAGVVDHYCLVADHRAHSIVDSLDGKIKSASTYGSPISWASYVFEHNAVEEPVVPVTPPKPGTIYTVMRGGETVWEIARKLKLGISGQDIADHNDIDAHTIVLAGTELHLPIALPQTEKQKTVSFELLDQPLEMHVIKSGGTRKFSFGHVKKWTDITPTGPHYPEGTNVKILAIATVPIPEDGSEAAYYMEGLAVGDFRRTGRMSFMMGFNHSHLAEGHVEAVQPAPKPEVQAQLDEAEKALEEAQIVPEVEYVPEIVPASVAIEQTTAPIIEEEWKQTIQPLFPDHQAIIYLFKEDTTVRELTGARPPRFARASKGVRICCTVWKDGTHYGLPASHENSGLLYGVPMDKIWPEDEIFDYSLSDEARIGLGRLTDIERYWYVPLAKASSHYVRFKNFITKPKTKEKK